MFLSGLYDGEQIEECICPSIGTEGARVLHLNLDLSDSPFTCIIIGRYRRVLEEVEDVVPALDESILSYALTAYPSPCRLPRCCRHPGLPERIHPCHRCKHAQHGQVREHHRASDHRRWCPDRIVQDRHPLLLVDHETRRHKRATHIRLHLRVFVFNYKTYLFLLSSLFHSMNVIFRLYIYLYSILLENERASISPRFALEQF